MTYENSEDERDVELSSIAAIFPELSLDPQDPHIATLKLEVAPAVPFHITFKPQRILSLPVNGPRNILPLPNATPEEPPLQAETDTHVLSHLPPLHLSIHLPSGYPDNNPPQFTLAATLDWLPAPVLQRLHEQGKDLWEEYGHSQVVYAFIDSLQQEAQEAFGLGKEPFSLPHELKVPLLSFDKDAKRQKFEQETFHCGVCLEPKKGAVCHRLRHCGHVFCVGCLQDFYNTAITEGDVQTVKCLEPDCGKSSLTVEQRRKKKQRTLQPIELLEIPLERAQVQRYVGLKLKKKLESDKSTIYCPRKWCQGPARSKKYSRYNTRNIEEFPESDSESEADVEAEDPAPENISNNSPLSPNPASDRLAICSVCTFAFCSRCHKSWHGDFFYCRSIRFTNERTAEEQASYDYILLNTSPCPSCRVPCQKIHGCNHMNCSQCGTHFCYLCSAWLKPTNPYGHFDVVGSSCYMRLWELEEGDEGLGNGAQGNNVFGGVRAAEVAAYFAAAVPDIPPPLPPAAAEVPVMHDRFPDQGIEEGPPLDLHVPDGADLEALPVFHNEPAGPNPVRLPPARAVPVDHGRVNEPRAPPRQRRAVGGRNLPDRRGGPREALQREALQREALQRFLRMAQADEEDEWDSDELELEGLEWPEDGRGG